MLTVSPLNLPWPFRRWLSPGVLLREGCGGSPRGLRERCCSLLPSGALAVALLGGLGPGGTSPIASRVLAVRRLPSELSLGRLSPPSPGGQGSSPWPPAPGCLSGAPARPPRAEESSTRSSAVTGAAGLFISGAWLRRGDAVGGSRGGSCLFPPAGSSQSHSYSAGTCPGGAALLPRPCRVPPPRLPANPAARTGPVPLPCAPKRPSTLPPRPPRPRSVTGTCVPAQGAPHLPLVSAESLG